MNKLCTIKEKPTDPANKISHEILLFTLIFTDRIKQIQSLSQELNLQHLLAFTSHWNIDTFLHG